MKLANIMAAVALAVTCSMPAWAQTTPEIARGNCTATRTKCEKTLQYCLNKAQNTPYQRQSVLNSLKDCIAACRLAENMMARESVLDSKAALLCVDACFNCTKSLESFHGDDAMNATANECRKCLANCQRVASAPAGNVPAANTANSGAVTQ